MTDHEFNNTQWYFGMYAKYGELILLVASVDFEEGIVEMVDEMNYRYHARYENITIISKTI
jgi:hypothetical protein